MAQWQSTVQFLILKHAGFGSGVKTRARGVSFEVRHPPCVGSITNNFCVLHNEVEHNSISPSSTLGLQLHVSALYVGHLQVVIELSEQLYKMCGVFF